MENLGQIWVLQVVSEAFEQLGKLLSVRVEKVDPEARARAEVDILPAVNGEADHPARVVGTVSWSPAIRLGVDGVHPRGPEASQDLHDLLSRLQVLDHSDAAHRGCAFRRLRVFDGLCVLNGLCRFHRLCLCRHLPGDDDLGGGLQGSFGGLRCLARNFRPANLGRNSWSAARNCQRRRRCCLGSDRGACRCQELLANRHHGRERLLQVLFKEIVLLLYHWVFAEVNDSPSQPAGTDLTLQPEDRCSHRKLFPLLLLSAQL
mmetsp:Transcript_59545/g.128843  ORF Transcript_59545/g.128843 Transcript_59545/m.128843 type:complete len:261 (+) Transcript_59545:1902-2684(+)